MTLFNRGCLSLFALLPLGLFLYFFSFLGAVALYRGAVQLIGNPVITATAQLEEVQYSGFRNGSCRLSYRFSAAGRTYRSTQVGYFDHGGSDRCGAVARLRDQTGPITVHYLERDPTQSFLVWGLPTLLLVTFLPLAFYIAVVLMIWTSPSTRVG